VTHGHDSIRLRPGRVAASALTQLAVSQGNGCLGDGLTDRVGSASRSAAAGEHVVEELIVSEPSGGGHDTSARPAEMEDVLDIVWPETGLQTGCRVSSRPKDTLGEDDLVELEVDFVKLTLSPLEFIQLASFLRMSIDGLLERHPGLQRAVVNAFDIRD